MSFLALLLAVPCAPPAAEGYDVVEHELQGGGALLTLPLAEGTAPLVLLGFRGGAAASEDPHAAALHAEALAVLWRARGGARDAVLDVRLEPDALVLELDAGPESVDAAIDALIDLLANPKFGADVLLAARARRGGAVEWEDEDAEWLLAAERVLTRVLQSDDAVAASFPDPALSDADAGNIAALHAATCVRARLVVAHADARDADGRVATWESALTPLPVGEPLAARAARPFTSPIRAQVHLVDRPEATRAAVVVGAPGVRADDPDAAEVAIWTEAVGGEGAGLLPRALREREGLACRTGAAFEARWGRRTPFRAWVVGDPATVRDAIGPFATTLAAAREPIPAEPLEAARARLLGDVLAPAAYPRAALRAAFARALVGAPPEAELRLAEELRTVDAESVAEAVRRRLALERTTAVVVGPADVLRDALAPLGEVVDAEPPSTTPGAEAGEEPLVERVRTAIGAEAWSEVRAVEARVDVGVGDRTVSTTQRLDLTGPRFSIETEGPDGAGGARTVLDGDVARVARGGSVRPVDAAPLAAEARRGAWSLLHRLASRDGGLNVATEDGALRLTDTDGLDVRIDVGDDGRPIRVRFSDGGVDVAVELGGWAEAGALRYPTSFVDEARGRRFVTRELVPHARFDPTWVE